MRGDKTHQTTRLVCALALGFSVVTQARIIYVDDDAPPGGDGISWATAYRFLQDGFFDATAGDEIRVAGGLYKPDEYEWVPDGLGTGDREECFELRDGMSLVGGYAGLSASDPNARNVAVYETVLSGDLLGNDAEPDVTESVADGAYRYEVRMPGDQFAILVKR